MSPRGSLQRGLRAGPGSGAAGSLWAQEFSALDDHMTTQLLNIQQQAVALALLAQRAEDEQNAALGVTGGEGTIEEWVSQWKCSVTYVCRHTIIGVDFVRCPNR